MKIYRRLWFFLACSMMAACQRIHCSGQSKVQPATHLMTHTVQLDSQGKILSWAGSDSAYAHVVHLAWRALIEKFPVQPNGLQTYFSHSRFDPHSFAGDGWPHNPAGLNAMLVDSAIQWYTFSGDYEAIELVRKLLNHQLTHGTTPSSAVWAQVPYASSKAGSIEYHGVDDGFCDHCGRGDGDGVIEPDKVGELGYGYLRFYEHIGDENYRKAAIACADALARHVRAGDETHSPWPFRVHAETGVIREEYSANVIGAVRLLDELSRLKIGNVDRYQTVRTQVWSWMMKYPMQNNAWSGYFEDIPIQRKPTDNLNQYSALQTAYYLLEHPEYDSKWRTHVEHLLKWVRVNFAKDVGDEPGQQFGADVLSEQFQDMAKMGSHTARYAAVHALYFAKTGEVASKEIAFRSFNWATYACDSQGIVQVGPNLGEGWWFSDGYGDYLRHFLTGMAAVPEWAPSGKISIVHSTSVVVFARYEPDRVRYVTFDASSIETMRMRTRPSKIVLGNVTLSERSVLDAEGFQVEALPNQKGFVVRVRHDTKGDVEVYEK